MIRYYKLLYDTEKFCAYAHKKTPFIIAILAYDWIDEKNVYLVTDNQHIQAQYLASGYLVDDLPMYSIFGCTYKYKQPCKNMEAHWFFKVGFREFSTESIKFNVLKGI